MRTGRDPGGFLHSTVCAHSPVRTSGRCSASFQSQAPAEEEDEGEEEETEELGQTETYAEYVPSKCECCHHMSVGSSAHSIVDQPNELLPYFPASRKSQAKLCDLLEKRECCSLVGAVLTEHNPFLLLAFGGGLTCFWHFPAGQKSEELGLVRFVPEQRATDCSHEGCSPLLRCFWE